MSKPSELSNPIYHDEDAAWVHYEKTVWPDGPICPKCGSVDNAARVEAKTTKRTRKLKDGTTKTVEWTRRGVCRCKDCGEQFTATVNTVFEDSHIPMHKWLLASHLMNAGKRGVSALELQRLLGLGSYRSAWFMAHRLREAMGAPAGAGPLGGTGKIVEADETYYGSRKAAKPEAPTPRGKHRKHANRAVVALVERGGRSRVFHVASANKETLAKIITENVDPGSRLHTDESRLYVGADAHTATHETVHHTSGEYARGDVHTNSAEGFFGQFKSGMIGVYSHCDEKYLSQYLKEYEFRHNHRAKLGYDDKERAALAVRGAVGKRLTLRQPKGSSPA